MQIRRTSLALLPLVGAAALPAQGVGSVGEIVVLGQAQAQQCPLPARRADPARPSDVRILGGDGMLRTVQPGQRDSVRLNDQLFVARQTDVRLLIASNEYGLGTFTLAPKLLCTVRGAYRGFLQYGLVDTASYSIGRSADGGLVLGVIAGGAIVRWIRDDARPRPLTVIAGGRPVVVEGTEFAVAGDAAASRALVYMTEGSVRFPEVPGVTATAGQLYELTLRPLAATLLGATVPNLVASAAQDVASHRALFPTDLPTLPIRPGRPSLLRRPLTYVVAASAGLVGYCGLVSGTKCGLSKSTPSRRGTVIVEVPL